jgi:CRISPR type I-E-associated protein CasB/Cse2
MSTSAKSSAEEAFIGKLLSKANAAEGKGGKPGDARRDLAEIRGILRDQPYDLYRAGKHIVPALDDAGIAADDKPENYFKERCYYQVAGLFALAYREVRHSSDVSFGAALRNLRLSDKGSDSLDGRFLTLLNCSEDRLFDHLRSLIGLLQAAGKMQLDWTSLLVDVQHWSAASRYVQRKWARHYYRADTQQYDATATDDTNPEDEGE